MLEHLLHIQGEASLIVCQVVLWEKTRTFFAELHVHGVFFSVSVQFILY